MIKVDITAAEIAKLVDGQIIGNADKMVNEVSSLKEATPLSVSFVGNKKYQHQLGETQAGIVLICEDLANEKPSTGNAYIVCKNVDYCFSKVIMVFAPPSIEYQPRVEKSAYIAPGAKLGRDVYIGHNAVIEENAVIGDRTIIGAGSYVGHQTVIGSDCRIAPNVTIMFRCQLGNKVVIHSGVVVGGDGFGFVPGPNGLVKVPQVGIVQIDDDVEIGANTTIDRARFGRTWIKSNVKIDKQVMVAHNVVIGESSILVAQCGIAGSSQLGRGVILAAKSGVNGHITLGDGAQVAGTSGVHKSLPPGAIAMGTPAETQREFMYRLTLPKKVEKLTAKLDALTKELAELKKSVENK